MTAEREKGWGGGGMDSGKVRGERRLDWGGMRGGSNVGLRQGE